MLEYLYLINPFLLNLKNEFLIWKGDYKSMEK